MKYYKSIIFIFVLMAGSVIKVSAQREAKTSSARAAYGKAAYGTMGEPEKYKAKKKDKAEKPKKQHRNKVVKIPKHKSSRDKSVANRRRNVWAG